MYFPKSKLKKITLNTFAFLFNAKLPETALSPSGYADPRIRYGYGWDTALIRLGYGSLILDTDRVKLETDWANRKQIGKIGNGSSKIGNGSG